jgi:MFS family permease
VTRLLRANPTFRRLFLAHAISRAGDAFNTVALVVLVFQLTGSGVGVAGTVAFEILPVLLLGPFAGLLVDRYPRRRVMVLADIARAALAALIAMSHTSTPAAYAVAFGLSTGALLFNPAASSLVPELLESEDEIVDANSALWTVAVAAQIVLAPLAGVLIASVGVTWAFGLNAGSYLASAALLVGLRAGTMPADVSTGGWRRVADGIHSVRKHPLLARLAVVQALAALSAGATSGLLVILAVERFGLDAGGFGGLLAAIGIGAVAGPAVGRRSIRPGHRGWLFGPFAVRGVVDVLLAIVVSPVLAGVALVIYGMSTSTGMVAYQSTLQTEIPPEVRGRAFALYDVIWNVSRLVSLGLGGLLADRVGIRSVYLLGGVLLLGAAALGVVPRGPIPADLAALGRPD